MDHRPRPGPVQLRGPGKEPGGRDPAGRGPLHDRDQGGEIIGIALGDALRRVEKRPLLASLNWKGGRTPFDQAQAADRREERRRRDRRRRAQRRRPAGRPSRGKFSCRPHPRPQGGCFAGRRAAARPGDRLRRDGRLGQCRGRRRKSARSSSARARQSPFPTERVPADRHARRPSLSERRCDPQQRALAEQASPRSRRASRCRSGWPRPH